MKIGLFTDGLTHLSFEDALRKASQLGVQAIEIGTGNFSPAPRLWRAARTFSWRASGPTGAGREAETAKVASLPIMKE